MLEGRYVLSFDSEYSLCDVVRLHFVVLCHVSFPET